MANGVLKSHWLGNVENGENVARVKTRGWAKSSCHAQCDDRIGGNISETNNPGSNRHDRPARCISAEANAAEHLENLMSRQNVTPKMAGIGVVTPA